MFFSDLDRTIIYSRRFADQYSGELVAVEKRDGCDISYMTPAAYKLLSEIWDRAEFVPVTARTWDEIMRIRFIKENTPAIMVCEAGRVIYRFGKRDPFWDEHIENVMRPIKSHMQNVQARFFLQMEHLGCPAWNINEYMMMAKVDKWTERIVQSLESLRFWYQRRGYRLLTQERKIYLFPHAISKAKAVHYLIRFCRPSFSVSAGDAEMDYGMFRYTTHYIAPRHHTIPTELDSVTQKSGLEAGEEILSFVHSKLVDANE